MSEKMNISVSTSPFESPAKCIVHPGITISELAGGPVSPRVQVKVNGDVLDPSKYSEYRLEHPDIVEILVFPAGGDRGKNIARSVALIAVAAAATVATAGIAGPGAGAGLLALEKGAAAALTVVGSIAVNRLIPPSRIRNSATDNSESFSRLGALTGSRNRISPFSVVPRVYGKHRIFPPMSAKPFTEVVANQQYLRLLFCLGDGPLALSDPKIGETSIGSFDASNNFTSNGNFEDVQIQVAENPDLYSTDVDEVSPGVALDALDDSGIRTTVAGTDEIGIGLTFPAGLFSVNNDGDIVFRQVSFLIEYREVGETTWIPALGVKDDITLNCDGGLEERVIVRADEEDCANVVAGQPVKFIAGSSAKETYRVGIKAKLPSNGQFEVRVTRKTAAGGNQDSDSCLWSSFQSIKYERPTDMPGKVQLAMRIKATDQLSGILDNFSLVAQSRLAVYNGTSWDEPTFDPATGEGTGGSLTSNPAWIFADIITGEENARALAKSRLDADALKSWADWATTESFEYNGIIDSETTASELARSVAAAGRASYGRLVLQDGLHTVVRDLQNQTPVQMFTPRNTWDFRSTKTFLDLPHGLKVRFRNETSDWHTEEAIVYNDGYSEDGTNCLFDDGTGVCKTATKFETLEIDGVTNWDQAWRLARYRLAEARLRPEVYSLKVDAEQLICQRGDIVKVAHDVTLWGSRWGRVKEVTRDGSNNVTQIKTDEPASMQTGNSYQIRIRMDDGTFAVIVVDTVDGETDTLTVTTPAAYNIAPGDLFAFGEQTTETVDLKVIGVDPRQDLSAELTLVDAAPDIHNADSGSIPAFNPQITDPPESDFDNTTPPQPIVDSIRSDNNSLYRDDDGSYRLRLLVSFTVASGSPSLEVEGRYRRSDTPDGWSKLSKADANLGVVSLDDVERGKEYIVQIRSRYDNQVSQWVEASPHTVAGKNENPKDVTGFSSSLDQVVIRLSWTDVDEPDVKKYEIRQGSDWATGALIGFIDGTDATVKVTSTGSQTFWIKAVDTAGNKSANAVSSTVNVPSDWLNDVTRDNTTGQLSNLQLLDSNPYVEWAETDVADKNYRAVNLGGVWQLQERDDLNAVVTTPIKVNPGSPDGALEILSDRVLVNTDLEVAGTINFVNETNLQVEDKTITVNKNGTDGSAEGAGLIIERPSGNHSMLWDSTNGFVFSDKITAQGGIIIEESSFPSLTIKNTSLPLDGRLTIQMRDSTGEAWFRNIEGGGYKFISRGGSEIASISDSGVLTAQGGVGVNTSSLTTGFVADIAGDVRIGSDNAIISLQGDGNNRIEFQDSSAGNEFRILYDHAANVFKIDYNVSNIWSLDNQGVVTAKDFVLSS